jgi:hypothetical protein
VVRKLSQAFRKQFLVFRRRFQVFQNPSRRSGLGTSRVPGVGPDHGGLSLGSLVDPYWRRPGKVVGGVDLSSGNPRAKLPVLELRALFPCWEMLLVLGSGLGT